MKKKTIFTVFLITLFLCLCKACADNTAAIPETEEAALARAKEYAHAVNYDFKRPEKIYAFLWSGFREQMDEKDFVEAFIKERSYPYITPLYIFFPEVTDRTEDGGYIITFLQAARIVGMTYDIEMVYEDGNWFVKDWEQFPDGSYLEKFENIPYSLDWYYDLSELERGG